MSGGHFDYAYGHVSRFADELESILLDDAPNNDPLPLEIESNLNKILGICQKTAVLMKDTEWLFSGDIGEDIFLQRVNVTLKSLYKILKVD